jgi:hypothetical protein
VESSCTTGISFISPALPLGEKKETSSTRFNSKNFSSLLINFLLPENVISPSEDWEYPSARTSAPIRESSSGATA